MSGQPIEQRYINNPNMPVSESEHQLVEELLKQAYTEGAIDTTQFFKLLEQLWAAETGAALFPVLQVLPASLRNTDPVLGGDRVGGAPGEAPKGPSLFQRRR
ncbi:MAG: hypothetical protein LBJ43_07160 [Propionibacteriaceae bacterium]|jgi:hypothetical protein|nr:hypothetical protein [Propionibacteriaceae bacterium]